MADSDQKKAGPAWPAENKNQDKAAGDGAFSDDSGLALSPRQRRRKIRLEWGALALVAIALSVLTMVQREVIDLGPDLAGSQGVITLVSINVSVILIVLLIILVLRHLYRIFFDNNDYGSLQTKMVVAFICLSLLPTIGIYYYAYRQLVAGYDLWFNSQITDAMKDSIDLTESLLDMDNRVLASYGGDLLEEYRKLPAPVRSGELTELLEKACRDFHLTTVEYYDAEGRLAAQGGQPGLPPIYHDWFSRQLASGPPWSSTVETEGGELTRVVWPILPTTIQEAEGPAGFIAIGRLTMAPIRSQMEDVRHFLQGAYHEARKVQRPIRVTQLTALTAMAVLLVFIVVWSGSHLARSLARPVTELVHGTKRVAAGDWDFSLTPHGRSGDFVDLVNAFNQMTRDLKKLYLEVDSRHRFAQTVLKNVSTGVIILAADGRPRNLNQAAANILSGEAPMKAAESADEPDRDRPADRPIDFDRLDDFTLPATLATLTEEMLEAARLGRRVVERHARLVLGDRVLSLRAGLVTLLNEEKEAIGYMLTFDDLTELEKAQRLAAWREVARRIAHEVKNPLTPIQLSAQRLRRRFSTRLADQDDAGIFEECTEVIIRQVDEMKKLVDEFSQFARLPEIKARPGDFVEFLNESLALFRQAHKKVDFQLEIHRPPPVFSFDPEQMRRVLTNILDNAVAAMNQEGRIILTLDTDELAGLRLTVADSGPGIDPLIMDRLFDPHVSTKASGQGLGLAIVRTIVSDHGGFVKAKSSPGSGAKFTIELPLR